MYRSLDSLRKNDNGVLLSHSQVLGIACISDTSARSYQCLRLTEVFKRCRRKTPASQQGLDLALAERKLSALHRLSASSSARLLPALSERQITRESIWRSHTLEGYASMSNFSSPTTTSPHSPPALHLVSIAADSPSADANVRSVSPPGAGEQPNSTRNQKQPLPNDCQSCSYARIDCLACYSVVLTSCRFDAAAPRAGATQWMDAVSAHR